MVSQPFKITGINEDLDLQKIQKLSKQLKEMGFYCRTSVVNIYGNEKNIICYCYRDFSLQEMQDYLKQFFDNSEQQT